MGSRDEEFLKSLRETFRIEAAEHLQTITNGLLGLEKDPLADAQRDLVAGIFRAAHSLKGAARAVDYAEVEAHCQELEDLVAGWKKKGGDIPRGALDLAHRVLDDIIAILSGASRSAVPPPPPPPPSLSLPLAPPAAGPGPAVTTAATTPAGVRADSVRAPAPPTDTVRISAGKLEARLVEAEEMLTAKLTAGQRAADLRELARRFEDWREGWAAAEANAHALRRAHERAATAPAPDLARLLEFFDRARDQLKAIEAGVGGLARAAQRDYHDVGRLVDDLLADSKKMLLLPFGTLTASFPKLVRDLCRDQGKEADLVLRGEEVEVDKRILEEMKDPFIHLLRNCVDHGVEPPAERMRRDKAARATIVVSAAPADGNKVELTVSDDGAGIDLGRLRDAAVRQGCLTAEEAARLGDAAAMELIFRPEVSTSPMITRLSGRGLGMAIVREKAEKLGGRVTVESRPGGGTRFHVVLPSLLATFRGIIVEAGRQVFAVPTAQVERVGGVKPAEIRPVEGRETVALSGRAVPLVRLSDVLGVPAPAREPAEKLDFLVLAAGGQEVAFVVDAVLDELEVLVKPLRPPLVRVRHVAGATVLGSGRVAPVLHVGDLLKSAREAGGPSVLAAAAPAPSPARSILVAEDSITSRMLIKGMLESAGYRVAVAADGVEAFTQLRAERFDLLVSDVEMPRLDGFGLTARIRADRRLAELPVVLVTALETREDRERGIDAGANAYIVKSKFDQSNLLDAVRRLL